jgi:predicted signal transduction protein with EAL and GGDEF domain
MPCNCRSDARILAVLARSFEEYPELEALGPKRGWSVHRPLGAVRVDVGSGWLKLAMLGDLDPDLVKTDRELVARSVASPFHRGICAALVRLGQDVGELVLAEGVETEEEWRTLEALGVNLFQGYLFGRPRPRPLRPRPW